MSMRGNVPDAYLTRRRIDFHIYRYLALPGVCVEETFSSEVALGAYMRVLETASFDERD